MENGEGTESRNCNSCRKDFPLPDFQNRYGKKFRWCINCREKRCQGHNERSRRKAAAMTAPNADIALRRVQTDDVPREKFLAAELSALSELRHCASCHRHLPWSGFRKEPDLYFGHCIQCQDLNKPDGTAGGGGRQRAPLPNVRLPQISPDPSLEAYSSSMYPRAASVPKREANATALRDRGISTPQRALAATVDTQSDARPLVSRAHDLHSANYHCMSTSHARTKMNGPVTDGGFDDRKGELASQVKPGNGLLRSGNGNDEIGRAANTLLDAIERAAEHSRASSGR